MKKSFMLAMILVVFLLAACSASQNPPAATPVQIAGTKVSVTGGSYTNVSVAELQAMLENKDFTLVNVHIPFEGNLPKTDLSIAYDQVAQNLDKLPDKSAKIVLYCRSGRMSAIAAQTLVESGYTNIRNLDGGMSAWEQAGNPIQH